MKNRIGDAAGKIWKTLKEEGPMPESRLARAAGLPANLANQAIGWLAREDKLESAGDKGRTIRLKG